MDRTQTTRVSITDALILLIIKVEYAPRRGIDSHPWLG